MTTAEPVQIRSRQARREIPRPPVHTFTPDPETFVRNQCRLCWGWYDDPRHLTPMPLLPRQRTAR